MLDILFTRVAIYNKKIEVRAYDLLYNNAPPKTSVPEQSTITKLFTHINASGVLHNKMAFIHCTYNDIVQNVPAMLPKNKIIIELLETIVVDEQLLSQLKALRDLGYKIALDDFIYRKELKPLLELAHIIKIDVFHLSQTEIQEQLQQIQTQFNGKFLAKNIEDRRQFNECIELGFDYFHGFFLNKPAQTVGQTMTDDKIHLLHLLSILNAENTAIDEIERVILEVPSLANRILKITNSAAFYTGKPFDSLAEAIRQLGLAQIKSWVSMLMLTTIDNIAPDLLERTLIRAKMCELLAQELDLANPYESFTVGILSTLDSITNETMSKVLATMQLSETLKHALILKEGSLGALLQCVIHYEKGNFKKLSEYATNNHLLIQSYIDAIQYAKRIMDSVQFNK